MIRFIDSPILINAAGNKSKQIQEFIGNVVSSTKEISIALMVSPEGWQEPSQTPEFDEYTIVLKGSLKVETKNKTFIVNSGQAIIIEKNEWIKYSTPNKGGAEYIAVCLPAFSPQNVHRDPE